MILIFIILFSAGIISLLEEPMPELKVFALKKLDMIVDEFWPEISEAIEKMYVIYISLFNLLYSFDEIIKFDFYIFQ